MVLWFFFLNAFLICSVHSKLDDCEIRVCSYLKWFVLDKFPVFIIHGEAAAFLFLSSWTDSLHTDKQTASMFHFSIIVLVICIAWFFFWFKLLRITSQNEIFNWIGLHCFLKCNLSLFQKEKNTMGLRLMLIEVFFGLETSLVPMIYAYFLFCQRANQKEEEYVEHKQQPLKVFCKKRCS